MSLLIIQQHFRETKTLAARQRSVKYYSDCQTLPRPSLRLFLLVWLNLDVMAWERFVLTGVWVWECFGLLLYGSYFLNTAHWARLNQWSRAQEHGSQVLPLSTQPHRAIPHLIFSLYRLGQIRFYSEKLTGLSTFQFARLWDKKKLESLWLEKHALLNQWYSIWCCSYLKWVNTWNTWWLWG